MKIYKNNAYFNIFFFVFSTLYLIFFFKYNVKFSGYVFIGWIISLFGIFLFYLERKISRIILDKEKRNISFIYTSNFGREKEIFEFMIDEVNCVVNKVPGARGKSTFFEIIINNQNFDTFFIIGNGWDVDDLKDLIKEINKIKE